MKKITFTVMAGEDDFSFLSENNEKKQPPVQQPAVQQPPIQQPVVQQSIAQQPTVEQKSVGNDIKELALAIRELSKQENNNSKLESLLEQLILSNNTSNGMAFVNRHNITIPEEDIEEFSSTFFVNQNTRVVFDDVKNGRVVDAPYKLPIKFKPSNAVMAVSREDKNKFISVFQTFSKSQKEFLRNHSHFGITIFENVVSDIEENKNYGQNMDLINSAIARVGSMKDHEVMAEVIKYHNKIDVSNKKIDVLRKKLTKVYIEELAEKSRSAVKKNEALWKEHYEEAIALRNE